MKSFIKILLLIASVISGVITLIFSCVSIQQFMWDYNEEGNHFDVETSTNYTDGGQLVYGFLAVLFLVITIALLAVVRRLRRNG